MDGFTVIDKAPGMTSFRASAFLRKIYSEKKVGHTGTLDPMATGVLPVALGRASRFISFLPDHDKGYTAHLKFGVTTDTLDITGNVLSESEAHITAAQLEGVLDDFRGHIKQVPPMYSALSKDGVKLYKLARQGIEVEREAREVDIYSLTLSGEDENGFEITVSCSQGTYIRSLIADIGEVFGCGAVMTALRRTSSNGFTLAEAFTEEQIKADPLNCIIKLDKPFEVFPEITVSAAQAIRFSNGGELDVQRLKTQRVFSLFRVYSPERVFLGLGEITAEQPLILAAKRVVGK